jgi:glycosyltransferase involved in cell wall biosynthesis
MILDGWALGGAMTAAMTFPGTVELALLTAGGLLPLRRGSTSAGGEFCLAVVIPAHNEERHIARAVRSLLAADRTGLEVTVVVIADNCDDNTAEVAGQAGARVLQRRSATARGKGYALDFAFRALLAEGHDAFLIIDADSEVSSNLLMEAASLLRNQADAVQCRYLVRNAGSTVRTRLMNIAL